MPFFKYNNHKLFYRDKGKGLPLILIHGNSVSSRMHWFFEKKLKKHIRVISPDLPGHGSSERIDEWPEDFWFLHAEVVKELLSHLNLEKAVVAGYSGGALIAMNFALEYPEKTLKVIADSFEGEQSVDWFASDIHKDREKDKSKFMTRAFWFLMHGRDWKEVVDKDTEIVFNHHKSIGNFFHRDLNELKIPVLLTGTMKDQYIPGGIDKILKPLSEKIRHSKVKIYHTGSHPASLTTGKEYIKDLLGFIEG